MILFEKKRNSWFHDLLALVITILGPKTVYLSVTQRKERRGATKGK